MRLNLQKKHLLEEHWQPSITDRSPRSEWEKSGSKNIIERAREKIEEILATHKVKPLEKDVEREMAKIIKEKQKLSRNKTKIT